MTKIREFLGIGYEAILLLKNLIYYRLYDGRYCVNLVFYFYYYAATLVYIHTYEEKKYIWLLSVWNQKRIMAQIINFFSLMVQNS